MSKGVRPNAIKIKLVDLDDIKGQLGKLASEPVMVEGIVQIMRTVYDDYKAAREAGHPAEKIASLFTQHGAEVDPVALERQYATEKSIRRKNGGTPPAPTAPPAPPPGKNGKGTDGGRTGFEPTNPLDKDALRNV